MDEGPRRPRVLGAREGTGHEAGDEGHARRRHGGGPDAAEGAGLRGPRAQERQLQGGEDQGGGGLGEPEEAATEGDLRRCPRRSGPAMTRRDAGRMANRYCSRAMVKSKPPRQPWTMGPELSSAVGQQAAADEMLLMTGSAVYPDDWRRLGISRPCVE